MNNIGSGPDQAYAMEVDARQRYDALERVIHWFHEPRLDQIDELLSHDNVRQLFVYLDLPGAHETVEDTLQFLSVRARHAWQPFLAHLLDHWSDDEEQLRQLFGKSPYAHNIIVVWVKPLGGKPRQMRIIPDAAENNLLGPALNAPIPDKAFALGITLIPTHRLELQRLTLLTRTH